MPPTGLESMSEVSSALRSMPASFRVVRIPPQSPVSVCCAKRPSSAAAGLLAAPSKTATKNNSAEKILCTSLIPATCLWRASDKRQPSRVAGSAPACGHGPSSWIASVRRPTGRAARRQQPRRSPRPALHVLVELVLGLAGHRERAGQGDLDDRGLPRLPRRRIRGQLFLVLVELVLGLARHRERAGERDLDHPVAVGARRNPTSCTSTGRSRRIGPTIRGTTTVPPVRPRTSAGLSRSIPERAVAKRLGRQCYFLSDVSRTSVGSRGRRLLISTAFGWLPC